MLTTPRVPRDFTEREGTLNASGGPLRVWCLLPREFLNLTGLGCDLAPTGPAP